MRRIALTALCLAAVTTAGLTGCQPGPDNAENKPGKPSQSSQNSRSSAAGAPKEPFAGLSAEEIADKALTATLGAASLRVKGDLPDDETKGTVQIDMALNKKNECAGTMGMDGEGKADMIKTGDTVYMKYDEAFLRAEGEGEDEAEADAMVALMAGKWTKMSAKGADAEDIADFCDLDTVLGGAEDLYSDASSGGGAVKVTRGRTTAVDGVPALALKAKEGKDRYTLYVATEGKPYLLRLDSTSPDDLGTLTFSDFDVPVPAQAPTGDVVDLDALGG
ncbi:hypothetical protein [Streptomyces curacoi]|uniref:Lipoprotein n=1 Tax=Streptomyces curacoi TaxID=146536 RepID=A0A117P2U5_9ACTN|nr:hypothetical protein [Streptomyces curacoi]KUM72038.1 hypothetical protein AQI70_25445 [Streptomyces curacoi]